MEINYRIRAILEEHYGITVTCIKQRTGGWSALAFFIEDKNKRYFLKVFNKKRPSSVQWICAIDKYIPLVQWLHDNTPLHNNIVSPIFTKHQDNKCEDEGYVYLLSEYIEGITVAENYLSHIQINELAKILGILHESTAIIPSELMEKQVKETFDIDFCDSLFSFINNDLHVKDDAVLQIVKPYSSCLLELTQKMRHLSNILKDNRQQFVICHADAHNWNLMQGENLMLIDWENIKLAPQEQDLILNVTEPYAVKFLSEYKRYMNYDRPDFDAFEFYYLKRKLEDILAWIMDLREEELIKSEDITLEYLKSNLRSCTHINSFRSDLKKVFI